MSNHDLKKTDYSNTVMAQNPGNASAVSIFPLSSEESSQNVASESNENRPQPTVPQTVSSGGSSY